MINKVILVGNLGRNPETKVFEDGTSVTRLTIATDESYKDVEGNWKKQTEWHTVNTWKGLSERVSKELKKGSTVFVEGKLKTRTFKTSDGSDRTVTEIEAITVKSLDKKDKDSLFPPNQYIANQNEQEELDPLPF